MITPDRSTLTRDLALLIGLVAVVSLACDGPEEKGAAAAASADAPAAKAGGEVSAASEGAGAAGEEESPAADKAPLKVIPELKEAIEVIAARCELNKTESFVQTCPDDEQRAFSAKLSSPAMRLSAIDTFVEALESGDERKRKVAAALLSMHTADLGEAPGEEAVSAATAQRLIVAWSKLPMRTAALTARSVAHIAGIAGQIAPLYDVLDAHEDRSTAYIGYMGSGRYGGAATLSKIKELGASRIPLEAQAGFQASLELGPLDAKERAALCPWAQGFLKPEFDKLLEPGPLLVRCGGEWLDALLAHGEQRIEMQKWGRHEVRTFDKVCDAKFRGEVDDPGQCERARALLRRAVDDRSIKGQPRADSLRAARVGLSDEEARALYESYASSEVPELKVVAQSELKYFK